MTYYYHTNDKDFQLAYSHYSDPAYDGNGAAIFGKQRDGLRWEYADRLQQWEPEKHKAAWDAAVEVHGKKSTARRIETFLRKYFDDPALELECIITGTQQFNGYPWYAYGFTTSEAQS